MFSPRRFVLVAALGCLILPSSVSPVLAVELTTSDWKSPGDGLLLNDSNTGLRWLNLTQTQGMSYNQVLSGTQNPSSSLYGFSFASSTQVGQLFEDGGIPAAVWNQWTSAYDGQVANLLSKWGTLYTTPDPIFGNTLQSVAFTNSPNPEMSGTLLYANVILDPNDSTSYQEIVRPDQAYMYPWESHAWAGSALLAPVPEPSTFVLLAVGGISLVANAWRRRRAA